MMIKTNIWLVLITGLLFACQVKKSDDTTNSLTLSSPEGSVSIAFKVDSVGIPTYSAIFKEEQVIQPSKMGFELANGIDFSKGFSIKESTTSSFDETWDMVWGEQDSVRNYYNSLKIVLETTTAPKKIMHLYFRAYEDGIGFRYEIPKYGGTDSIKIMDELTEFKLNGTETAWWIPADYDLYEYLYEETRIVEIDSVNTPITLKTQAGNYLSLHEAALLDYTDMTLKRTSGGTLEANLVPWPDGVKVRTTLPLKTPWRMIQMGDKPGDLIESKLILNLNEPNKLVTTDWIRPLKYIGIWWGMHVGTETWGKTDRHGATTKNTIRHIDFAAANNIDAVLIEGWNAGWENWGGTDAFDFTTPYDDFDLKKVTDYAQEKGVEIIGHHETGANIIGYEKNLDNAFALYEKVGVNVVKTGYAGDVMVEGQKKHGQYMVNHYTKVMKEAARYEISLNVHEPIKFTGLRRTYPNLFTGEGVRGMEWNAWSDGNPPRHTTIVPFTRMLAGPLDYTPGIFDTKLERYADSRVHWHAFDPNKDKGFVHGTIARQMALMVVLYSPLQMAADFPENYEGQPAFQFIRDLKVDWDATKVVDAEIGDYVIIARKNEDDWFIGAVTDEEARTITTPFSFLDKGKAYEATIYSDGPNGDYKNNPSAVDINTIEVTSTTQYDFRMAAGGGQAIKISLKK